jgi:hypothetical protein
MMRLTRRSRLWVVYTVAVPGSTARMGAVCEQGEWDAMQAAEPGRHALVRAGIASEAEAEARRKQATAARGAPKAGRA